MKETGCHEDQRDELILLQSNDRPSPHDPQAKAESIKIRVLVRPVNGENLSPIRGMPGRLTRDPSPKYGLSTHFFLLSIFKSDPSRDSSAFWLD